jgi:phenylalanyl-tRNA synthetase alpha chain
MCPTHHARRHDRLGAHAERDLTIRDLTDPAQGHHAMQLVVDALVHALSAGWHCPATVVRDQPVVTLEDNYETLGFAADAVTRDARYTRYVDDDHVLRSHSSAMIPAALRRLAEQSRVDGAAPDDVLIACPGICFRRDSVDWQHTGTPHQIDLWRVRRGAGPSGAACTDDDLDRMIGLVVAAALPGTPWRTVPAEHPYTERGREVYAHWNGTWVEIGECGLAAPAVLRRAGLEADRYSGLAMGLGLDRLLMLRKGIPDIRLLRSTDPRVAGQLHDLAPYRPVSHMPAVRRDLSVVVGPDVEASAEVLGDRVRDALGPDSDVADTVEVLGETPYDDLPAAARDRLGIRPGQRNLLVRLVLRALDRTLTDADANRLRDLVYAGLHEGPVAEWACDVPPAASIDRQSGRHPAGSGG